MNAEQKLGAALFALQTIADTEPSEHWEELSYNNGHNVPCSQCEKMLEIARQTIKMLKEEQ